MIKKIGILPLLFSLALLFACVSMALPPAAVQSTAAAAQEFPAQLLEGLAEFDLAVQIQGDIRGNVGPCG